MKQINLNESNLSQDSHRPGCRLPAKFYSRLRQMVLLCGCITAIAPTYAQTPPRGLDAGQSPPTVAIQRGATRRPAASYSQLRSLRNAFPVQANPNAAKRVVPLLSVPPHDRRFYVPDPVMQHTPGPKPALTVKQVFDGVGVGMGDYAPAGAPPDPTGAAGQTQYLQWVNGHIAVFDKATGAVVLGPITGMTLFQSLGGPCAEFNTGDPLVQYDRAAGRWVLSQISAPGGEAGSSGEGYWHCVAVSNSEDATGGYSLYGFQYAALNDYPKMGVWPDGYYTTANMFALVNGGFQFVGAQVCAYDRNRMIAGQPATQQCITLPSQYSSLLPAEVDGAMPPPAGSPNYLVSRLGTADGSNLGMWKYRVDWNNPGNTSLEGPFLIPVALYNPQCFSSCVAQPDPTQLLDALGDRLMFRLAYRNIGGVERMVVNHSVVNGAAPNVGAVRWYEIRNMASIPSIYQQSSWSPDSTTRWMGSVAMDKMGNMALGYSMSSSSMAPSIGFAARLSTDPPNTLGTETMLANGGGSQISGLSRWGDYSHMSIDPTDDCTFWYTAEYLKADGSFNWSTRIGSFKFSSCN